MERNDIHRPSAIRPEEYGLVALLNVKVEDWGPGAPSIVLSERKAFNAHQKKTGGKFSTHEHGGTCHICGAWAEYTAAFYHAATNTYIETGMDCAAKLDMGDARRFKTFRKACLDAKHAKAGKAKAEQILKEAGLEKAWELYSLRGGQWEEVEGEAKTAQERLEAMGAGRYHNERRMDGIVRVFYPSKSYRILDDIVGRLVKYGNISDAQVNFLRKLLLDILQSKEREAKRAEERASAKDCPKGRMVVRGEVVKVADQENDYGVRTVMTVKSPDGWLVWGTVPSLINDEGLVKGCKVEFTATVEPSDNDPKFGFFKRPTKARNLTDEDEKEQGAA